MKKIKLSAGLLDSQKRLDMFIIESVDKAKGLSRSFIQSLIKKGNVFLNGENIIKPHQRIKDGDLIVFSLPEKDKLTVLPEDIKLKIIYEDESVILLDKPAGLVVHPGAGNKRATLVNALLNHTKRLSSINLERPGIVHRLDKDTSGIMVVAKNNAAHLALAEQFMNHEIKKKYAAIVKGIVEFDEGEIDVPIAKSKDDFKKMKAEYSENAREAKTLYRVIERSKNFTLLDLTPLTGRTHQLRVHLAYLGHPIAGDNKYSNSKGFPRMFLHAYNLGFIHPKKKTFMEFKVSIPKIFQEFIGNDK